MQKERRRMPQYYEVHDINGQPAFDRPAFEKAITGGQKRITVEDWSDLKAKTYQQIKWWKGVLLPKLAEDTGDSVEYWETLLKLAILPDDFHPVPVPWGKKVFLSIPSVGGLSCKKMNILIKGAVAELRDEQKYGDHFLWVTEPDSTRRSNG